jgi:psp operon transcriptional activator
MQSDPMQILGSSPAFLDCMDTVSRVAPLNRPILVIGERGTGKELVAARLHYLSERWNKPFQKLNCAALPEALLESELFGYEPGAFTGATKRRAGRFEVADNGTLFLDEIGNMSPAAQEKLLRVIEYGEFERVGGNETLKVDVRVIGATNIDLPAAAATGEFRHDLLDRLAFDVINIPPLRERTEDIEDLVMHFAVGMARELEWPFFAGFTKDAMESLVAYDWPGNIRELRNIIERTIARAWDGEEPLEIISFDPFDSPWRPAQKSKSGRIKGDESVKNVPENTDKNNSEAVPQAKQKPYNIKEIMANTEKKLLLAALERNRHNQRVTAKYVGLSYDQLRHALKKYDLL